MITNPEAFRQHVISSKDLINKLIDEDTELLDSTDLIILEGILDEVLRYFNYEENALNRERIK